jgi:hypothetical protein
MRSMRSTDVSEGGLEALIVATLTGQRQRFAGAATGVAREREPFAGADDYIEGHRDDFDRFQGSTSSSSPLSFE